MNAALEVLEKNGLAGDVDSLRVLTFAPKRILKVHQGLYSATLTKQVEDFKEHVEDARGIDPFSFLASRSMRGQCNSFQCRIERLDFLARYSALYANKVLVPLSLSADPEKRTEQEVAYEVSEASLIFLRLRPLIEAGLVLPVVMRSFHCEHTQEW